MKNKKKGSWKKRTFIIILVAAVCAGGVYGGYQLYKSKIIAPVVPVYNIMTEYEGDEMESSAVLTNESSQTVYLTDTGTVEAVYVSEGQQVSAGTPLLKYDASEVAESINEKNIALQQINNDIAITSAQLDKLKATTPISEEQNEDNENKTYQPTGPEKNAQAYRYLKKNAKAYRGEGTEEDPFVYLCTPDCYATSDFLSEMVEKQWYCVFETRADNKKKGELQSSVSWNGKHLFAVETGKLYSVRTGAEYIPITENNNDIPQKGYTKKELRSAISDKEKTLAQLQQSYRQAQMDLKQLQERMNDSVVTATIDGVVKKLVDLDEYEEGTPFLVVSASDGLYVKGQVSELYLSQLKTGDTVSGTDWMTGTEFTATVEKIEDQPATDRMDYDYGMGNGNVSYYNYYAFIEDTTGLENGDSVSVKLTFAEENTGIFIEKAYVKSENGVSVIYIQNEDGKLERKKVSTGREAWGSYVEILNGLSEEDYIAFPYADSAREGVKCKETDYLY